MGTIVLRGHHLDLVKNMIDYHSRSGVVFGDDEIVLHHPLHIPLTIASRALDKQRGEAVHDGLVLAERLLNEPDLIVKLIAYLKNT